MRYIPVKRVFGSFPRRTTMADAFLMSHKRCNQAGSSELAKQATSDRYAVRDAATSTIRWKEVA